MPANPLVAAIAAFGQGEAQGRERKRRDEMDRMQQERLARQEERQGALDRANAMMQQFQMGAPSRAEELRLRVQGEQDARNRARQEQARQMIGERFGAKEAGTVFRPDFDYMAQYDNLLSNEQRTAAQSAQDARAEAARQAAEDRLTRQLSAADARQARALAASIAARGEERAKPPSSAVQQEYFSHRTLRETAKKALELLERNPDAVGAMKGIGMWLPGTPTNREALGAEPEKIRTRNLLGDIGSLKIRERSGAAVTAAESPRFKPFIPAVGNDYQFNKTALEELIARADDAMAAADDEYAGFFSRRHVPQRPTPQSRAARYR